jgi:hypothetical protein
VIKDFMIQGGMSSFEYRVWLCFDDSMFTHLLNTAEWNIILSQVTLQMGMSSATMYDSVFIHTLLVFLTLFQSTEMVLVESRYTARSSKTRISPLNIPAKVCCRWQMQAQERMEVNSLSALEIQ